MKASFIFDDSYLSLVWVVYLMPDGLREYTFISVKWTFNSIESCAHVSCIKLHGYRTQSLRKYYNINNYTCTYIKNEPKSASSKHKYGELLHQIMIETLLAQ